MMGLLLCLPEVHACLKFIVWRCIGGVKLLGI